MTLFVIVDIQKELGLPVNPAKKKKFQLRTNKKINNVTENLSLLVILSMLYMSEFKISTRKIPKT